MANGKDPCAGGLSSACFKAHPGWAKMAFAYRLLCALAPPGITRRLQKYLLKAIFGPGVMFPPGWMPPPGITFPPGYTFPPGWMPGDPLPSGYGWPPGFAMPTGWQPGDPVPWDLILPEGYELPPGWTWGDPLPEGWTWPPGFVFPPGWEGGVPPIYVPPWEPGPINTGGGGAPAAEPVEVTIVASAGGGVLKSQGNNWADAVAGSVWVYIYLDQGSENQGMTAEWSSSKWFVWRSFLYFDLSSIPAGSTVNSVVVGVTGSEENESEVCIQKGTQSSPLVSTDWPGFEGALFGNLTWAVAVGEVLNTNIFTLNAAGIAYIESVVNSTAKLCLREYTKDYPNIDPGESAHFWNGIVFTEHPTVAKRPYITINYQ